MRKEQLDAQLKKKRAEKKVFSHEDFTKNETAVHTQVSSSEPASQPTQPSAPVME